MNYKKLIFVSIIDTYSEENKKEFFVRNFRNAEKQNYTIDEFFNGCKNIIDSYYLNIINKRLPIEKAGLTNRIKEWQELEDYHNPKTREAKLNDYQNKLNSFNTNTTKIKFEEYINDNSSNRTVKFLCKNDFINTLKALEEAKEELQPKKKKTKTKNIEPLNFELNANEVVYLFDILQDAGFLARPGHHEGSYYSKLETLFTAKNKSINHATSHRENYLKGGLRSSKEIKSKLIDALNKLL
tara:strand:+ start:1002 stop:1724 length:723 start_codon:yes stop_codon:yes gene_type:complete